jgi:hypothetical protein
MLDNFILILHQGLLLISIHPIVCSTNVTHLHFNLILLCFLNVDIKNLNYYFKIPIIKKNLISAGGLIVC